MLKIAYSPIYHHPLPKGHRFPMAKYSLLPEQLLYEGTCTEESFFAPSSLSEEDILRTHSLEYWTKLKTQNLSRQEERKTGFPLSKKLVEREITICQGTIDNALFAIQHGVSINIAGGTHHAYKDSGEGFCLLNDIAIASNWLLAHGKASQILVVDLDVHQGNGTAKIFENQDRVFTFSIHGEHNYPLHKEKSDLDIPLKDGTDDATYLKILESNLNKLIESIEPDFIFFQSGVDVLASDKLGRLGLTIQGCRKRDELVFKTCKRNNLPVAVNMGGGYSEKLSNIVEAHANTYRLAQEIWF